MKRNILYVYGNFYFPMRSTWWERLRAFRRYSPDRVFYLDLTRKTAPGYLRGVHFDLILFDTLFLTYVWQGATCFRAITQRAASLKQSTAIKAILPQDEFTQSDLLCEFIREFNIDLVFSVAPADTWPKIYDKIDARRVHFCRVLSTYLDEDKLPWITALGQAGTDRRIDIGYRTPGATPFWFGRHGFLKKTIAEVFQRAGPATGLRLDISTEPKDAVMGDAWYRFLAGCKYTLGVESGTSILDRDSSIRERTEAYLAEHPEASFTEVEQACFPGVDGKVTVAAIASRHFEACAARTCQILTAGDYNGILKPGLHYIELKRDFSNLAAVLDLVARDELRAGMVERAFQEVVASGKYTYRSFVEHVSVQACLGRATAGQTGWRRASELAVYVWMRAVEQVEIGLARWKGRIQGMLKRLGLPVIRWQPLPWREPISGGKRPPELERS